jgi:hypothetical protein
MRIERHKVKGRVYIYAVEDEADGTRRRVASFGEARNARTKRRLCGFLDALEGSEQYPKIRRKTE